MSWLILSIVIGASPPSIPIVDIPEPLRKHNWHGSCVHVSMVTLLRWQGRADLADWWWEHYDHGESSGRFARRLKAAGIKFAQVTDGEVWFIEWAIRTRRGCNVAISDRHFVTLVHLDANWAGILDNESPHKIKWWSREKFIKAWQRSGGWAVTPVYDPPPPKPWR